MTRTDKRFPYTTLFRSELRSRIEGGMYAPGDKLPTEQVLVEKFGFSRTVIREAVATLRADGLLESRQGAGVFVLGPQQSDETLTDRKSTRLNSSHSCAYRMPSSA